jgi:hypothetical protein
VQFRATVVIEIDGTNGADIDPDGIKDYCQDAVRLNIDTEEYGNQFGLRAIQIEWDALTQQRE